MPARRSDPLALHARALMLQTVRWERTRFQPHGNGAALCATVGRMTSPLVRRVTLIAAFVGIFVSCLPDGGGTSSSSGGGGGVIIDGGASDGAASDAGEIDSGANGREDLCAAYASATASCCVQGAETCRTSSESDWNNFCLGFARKCVGMPTCFTGTDCNTLVFCGGSC
jgi:hypothetical protein